MRGFAFSVFIMHCISDFAHVQLFNFKFAETSWLWEHRQNKEKGVTQKIHIEWIKSVIEYQLGN